MARKHEDLKDLALYLDERAFRMSDIRVDTTRWHMKIGFVVADGSTIRNPDTTNFHQLPYSFLSIEGRCFVELSGLNTYGLETIYDDPYMVDLQAAEYMVKMLRRVQRGLSSSDQHPRTYGDYCALISGILKIRRLVLRTDDAHASSFRDMTFEYFGQKQIAGVVDSKVKALIKGETVRA